MIPGHTRRWVRSQGRRRRTRWLISPCPFSSFMREACVSEWRRAGVEGDRLLGLLWKNDLARSRKFTSLGERRLRKNPRFSVKACTPWEGGPRRSARYPTLPRCSWELLFRRSVDIVLGILPRPDDALLQVLFDRLVL